MSQIDLPNGSNLKYSYDSVSLTKVEQWDLTSSEYVTVATYSSEVVSAPIMGTDGEDYGYSNYFVETTLADGHSARPYEGVRKIYTTVDAITAPSDVYTTIANDQDPLILVYNQASQLVQIVANGDDEVLYMSFDHAYSGNGSRAYEGGGRCKTFLTPDVFHSEVTVAYYSDWSISSNGTFSGTAENNTIYSYGSTGASTTDARGITHTYSYPTTYTYAGAAAVTIKSYEDNSFEAYCYNDFKQITRYRDRNAHVTYYTYDDHGNMIKKEVGLIDQTDLDGGEGGNYYYGGGTPNYNPCDGTNDVQTDEYAIHQWSYYADTSSTPYLLKSYTDPTGNVTDYEYYDDSPANAGFFFKLKKVIQPADVAQGTRAETLYEYDSAGRLATITAPDASETDYDYDTRGRLSKITYNDGTTERWIYGTGTDANLLIKEVDRNNIVTKYEYDDSGRRTKTIRAYATMDASGTETLITDPALTVEEVCTYLDGTNLKSGLSLSSDSPIL